MMYEYCDNESRIVSLIIPMQNTQSELTFKRLCAGHDHDRIIQHSGLFPDYDEESEALAASRTNVKNVTLHLDQFWGSGIVHAKVWIADRKDLYIGSANNDWKSLTQVGDGKPYTCI